jgi:hypothetical protein
VLDSSNAVWYCLALLYKLTEARGTRDDDDDDDDDDDNDDE